MIYKVEINDRTIEGTAAEVLQGMSEDARLFEGTPAEYIDWIASNVRRTRGIFLDTAPGRELEKRQEVLVHELLKHQLIKISREGQRREKRKPTENAQP